MVWHRIGQKSVRATLGTERVCVSVVEWGVGGGGGGVGRSWSEEAIV